MATIPVARRVVQGMTTTSGVDPGCRVEPGDSGAAASFDDFVDARSRALLRTAYRLTRVAKPGATVVVRAYVTSSGRGTRMLPADQVRGVWMGFGIYGPVAGTSVGGWSAENVAELYGHTWRLATTRTSSGAPIVVPAADRDRLATTVWSSSSGYTSVEFHAGDSRSSGEDATGGGQAANPDL